MLKTISECFPVWESSGSGIFSALTIIPGAVLPFSASEAVLLDFDYIQNIAHEQAASAYLQRQTEKTEYDEAVTVEKLAALALARFGVKWNKIHTALLTEYEPLENYSAVENFTDTTTFGKNTVNGGTDNRTVNLDDTRTGSEDVSSEITAAVAENETYGFNSSTPVPTDKNESSNSGISNTVYNSVKDAHTGTDERAINNTETESGTETLEHEFTRHGNIGVTTSQQMLQSEIELRQYIFNEQMFSDISALIGCGIYQY